MAVEVQAFIDVALAFGVDEEPERVVVLLELVADREIAIGRSVDVPRHRMGTGPMAVGPCADRHRHVEPGAHIESRTAHPRHFPTGAKVLCPHFRIGLEAAAGEHHSAGPDRDRRASVFRDDAREPPIFTDETGGGRLIENRDAAPLHIGIERVEQLRPAAPDVQCETAPEFEFSVDLVGLPSQPRPQLHTLLGDPFGSVQTAAHENFQEIRVGPVLGQREKVVKKLVLRVGSKVDVLETLLRQRWQHSEKIVDACEREPEGAAGIM